MIKLLSLLNGALVFVLMTSGCSSAPTKTDPSWTQLPTRQVDNGYIVYIGYAEEPNLEKAEFKAEGLALEDIANECSVIPKGTRLEDRYNTKDKYFYRVYVKVALEFQECEKAKNAVQPNEIKNIANASFTQQLKKYQDLVETGDMPKPGESTAISAPETIAAAPVKSMGMNDSVHFYSVRQYVAYQKEIVVLAPPEAYAAHSVQTQQFIKNIQPATNQVQALAQSNPALENVAWSKMPDRPVISKPAALAAKNLSHQPSLPASLKKSKSQSRKEESSKSRRSHGKKKKNRHTH